VPGGFWAMAILSCFLLWPLLAIVLAHRWGKICDAPLVVKRARLESARRSARSVPFRPPNPLAHWVSQAKENKLTT
jgi:hypothetical protein